jgi:hypothetical protein
MRHTSKQKAVLISASTLVLLTTSPFAAQAKDGKREGAKETKTSQDSKPESKDTRSPEVAKNVEAKKVETKKEDDKTDEDKHEKDEHDDREHGTTTLSTTSIPTTSLPTTTTPSPPSSTSTIPGSTTSVPAVTSTTKPVTTTTKPVTTTTKVAPALPLIRASQVFLATKIGAPIRMDTTVTNDAITANAVSVVITMSSTGALPHFLEAKALSGTWSCSAYAEIPVSPQKYTCTGTLAAKSSGAITVSSGSAIMGAVGQSVIAGVVVSPSGVAAGATATYN